MLRPLAIALSLAALLVAAGAGTAQAGSWGLEFDNDRIANTDRHFTHGTRLFWQADPGEVPDWASRLADALPLIDGPGTLGMGAALGQNMFTPADITDPDVIPGDRPYAGWLYGALALSRTHDGVRRAWELDLGVVGPASFARQTQIVVHRIVGARTPRGWANQLNNEPGAMLIYEQMWQTVRPIAGDRLKLALTPHAGASLGNVYTYGSAGGTLRIGDFADDDFGPARIRPGVPGTDAVGGSGRSGLDWYAFAGADGRLVARNIFLDGNTFADSHHVDKRRAVLDLQVGVTLALPSVRLTFMEVFRTREFEGQPAPDRFGVAEAAFRF